MYSWDETLPYNATHALRVEGVLRVGLLREAIRASLMHCGYPAGEDELLLEEHAAGACAEDVLHRVVQAQLNRRFDEAEQEVPFRFFVIREGSASFLFGVCYFHPVAGADTILWFLEDVVGNYAGCHPKGRMQWNLEEPPRYRSLLWRRLVDVPGWLASLPGYVARTRHYARKKVSHRAEASVGTVALRLDEEEVEWIRRKMEEQGATFHEVLLALVIQGLARMLPERWQHAHRREIAVGSIINIREEFGTRAAQSFGLFLSSFFVSDSVPPGEGLTEVLGRVQRQTRAVKRRRLHLRNLVVLEAYLLFKRMFNPERYRKMFVRGFPLLASVTSFFVDRFQRRLERLPVTDYWRAVSASLATPLVLSVTSFRGRTNVTVSYNREIYQDWEVEDFLSLVRDTLVVPRRMVEGELVLAG